MSQCIDTATYSGWQSFESENSSSLVSVYIWTQGIHPADQSCPNILANWNATEIYNSQLAQMIKVY